MSVNAEVRHLWTFDGPSWLAGSGVCAICKLSDEEVDHKGRCYGADPLGALVMVPAERVVLPSCWQQAEPVVWAIGDGSVQLHRLPGHGWSVGAVSGPVDGWRVVCRARGCLQRDSTWSQVYGYSFGSAEAAYEAWKVWA